VKKAFKIIVMTIGAFLITAGHSQANTVTFTVIDAGTYMATLTDFEFPVPIMLPV